MKHEFKGTNSKWESMITRSSNFNGIEAIVVFSEKDNKSIDEGICRLTVLDNENKVIKDSMEMKANALLISKAPEMLEMLQSLENDNNAINELMWNKIQKLIESATKID